MRYIIALLALFWLASPGLRADDDPNPLGPPIDEIVKPVAKKPVKLFGIVEHSPELPPVPAHLKAGATINVAKLKALTPNNQWFRIPAWFAGTWETRNHTTYYTQSLITGSESFPSDRQFAVGSGTAGFQKDRKGDIWEFAYGEYLSIWKLDGGYDLHLVHYREPTEVTNNKVVMMFRSHQCLITAYTHRVLRTQQTESIQTYTPVGNGVVRVDASVKAFDEDGKPVRLSKILAYKRRKVPFQPWDKMDGRDMRKLFNEYLESHGLSDLRTISTAK